MGCMKIAVSSIIGSIFFLFLLSAAHSFDLIVLSYRIYGADQENAPPILLLSGSDGEAIGYEYLTFEIDVRSSTPPLLLATLLHCNAFWQEDQNLFINDPALRTTIVDWIPAPTNDAGYDYRGKLRIPFTGHPIQHGGNWKIKIFSERSHLLAEARFFVVTQMAKAQLNILTDFYTPQSNVSPAAFTFEMRIQAPSLFDQELHTVTFYRNHRWYEPLIVSAKNVPLNVAQLYAHSMEPYISGFLASEKRFLLRKVPAENEYRLLDLQNVAMYPTSQKVLTTPLTDLKRNGQWWEFDNDGALITTSLPAFYDRYQLFEFRLNPESAPLSKQVFVVGSFNNWIPTPEWELFYDSETKLYRLRNFLRRGIHNYMYVTGLWNATTQQLEHRSFEEFEGNTFSVSHTIYAFAYYHVPDYGGYDTIIAVAQAPTN